MPSGNNSSTQGFAQPELDLNEPGFEDLQNAVKLEELKFQDVELKDFLNKFVIGIKLGDEQLTDFTLLPPKSSFNRLLGDLLRNNAFKLAPVMASYLPTIIDTVGGYSFKDLASKLSTSPSQLIQGMAMGDILLLILNSRINNNEGKGDVLMSVKCPRCGFLNKDTKENCHDLNTITVKVPPRLHGKFIVEVNLNQGFKVGKDLVKRVFMEPLKLYQVRKLGEPDPGNPEDVTALTHLITEIPEAEDYRHIKGKKFSGEDYDKLSLKDVGILESAMELLVPGMPGPEVRIEMVCVSCQNEWEADPGWADLRSFLFGFAKATR
jgi:hypothetical protein